jgi:hypothetical protein
VKAMQDKKILILKVGEMISEEIILSDQPSEFTAVVSSEAVLFKLE